MQERKREFRLEDIRIHFTQVDDAWRLSPALRLSFLIDNRSDHEVFLDKFLYRLRVSIGSWTPEVGSGAFLEKRRIVPLSESSIDDVLELFPHKFELIDKRTIDPSFRELFWKADIAAELIVKEVGEFQVRREAICRTPASDWRHWAEIWKKWMESF